MFWMEKLLRAVITDAPVRFRAALRSVLSPRNGVAPEAVPTEKLSVTLAASPKSRSRFVPRFCTALFAPATSSARTVLAPSVRFVPRFNCPPTATLGIWTTPPAPTVNESVPTDVTAAGNASRLPVPVRLMALPPPALLTL